MPFIQTSSRARQRLLARLDSLDRVVTAAYRMFLRLLIAAILGGTAFVVVKQPWGAGHQGEWFYFTIAVLLALGWAVGEYIRLGRRQRHSELLAEICADAEHDTPDREPSSVSRGNAGASGNTTVRFGDFQFVAGSLARDVLPDEAAVARLQAELDAGSDLDEACRTIQPAYAEWNALARWAYRSYATGLIRQAGEIRPASPRGPS